MIGSISSWAKGIIFVIVISGIIEIIMPEGNNKKYVKTIIGIYIVFVVIYPIISKISGKKINLESILNKADKEARINYIESTSIDTNSYIEQTYKKKIEDDIKNNMKDKGYILVSISLEIETENEERYGEIKEVSMSIDKAKDKQIDEIGHSNVVNNIEKVEVSISNKTIKEKSEDEGFTLNKEEINSLKQFFNTTYGIDISRIHINE